MEKVFISKVLKGKDPQNAVGMIDTEAKKLYVPFVSKKGTPMIDIIDVDYLSKTENGYRCEVVRIDENDRHFINVYFANKFTKKGE